MAKTAKTTKESPELPSMPEADPIAQAARRFLTSRNDEITAKEAKEVAAGELAQMMRTAKRKTLKVDGATIELKHVEASDSLVVKAQKTQ